MVLHLANYFIKNQILFYLGCVMIVYIFVTAMLMLPVVNRRVCLSLFGIGAALMIWKGMPLPAWFQAIDKNGSLMTLFIAVPMMYLPFFYSDYQEELKHVAQLHMRSLVPFAILTFAVSHIFGVLIAISAIALVYELFKKNAKLYDAEDTFMAFLMRGYVSSGFWSPAWASILVVTTQLKVPWISIIPWGVSFALLLGLINTALVAIMVKRRPDKYPKLSADEGVRVDWKQVYILLGLAAALISSIVIMSIVTPWDLMIIIPLVSSVFPVASGLIQGKMPQYKAGMKNYYHKSSLKVMGEVALFAAAGFLTKALEYSGVGAMITGLIPAWMPQYPVLLIGTVMILMILPALAGVHPVAVGTALATTVVPASIGLTDFTFALTIVTGWAFAIQFSPFAAVTLIAGGLVNRLPWEISLGLSGRYGIACVIIFSFLIAAINKFM